jgi:hypothetical protein
MKAQREDIGIDRIDAGGGSRDRLPPVEVDLLRLLGRIDGIMDVAEEPLAAPEPITANSELDLDRFYDVLPRLNTISNARLTPPVTIDLVHCTSPVGCTAIRASPSTRAPQPSTPPYQWHNVRQYGNAEAKGRHPSVATQPMMILPDREPARLT